MIKRIKDSKETLAIEIKRMQEDIKMILTKYEKIFILSQKRFR